MRSIALILILTGCGTAPSTSTNAPVADKTAPTTSTDPSADPAPTAPTVVAPEGIYAVSLANVAELPECSKINAKQLAYVKADAKFYSCETTGWASLEVVGAKGDKGDAGAAGAAGKDGQPTPTNEWYDAVAQRTWLIGASTAYASAATACTGEFTLPTTAQATAASLHGLGGTVSGSVWTSDTVDATYQYGVVTSNGNAQSLLKSDVHPTVCLKN